MTPAFSDRIFSDRLLWTFPCNSDKEPRTKHGFKSATQNVWWPRAELVGVPTGKRNGFDILDIDGSAGRKWYFNDCDRLPPTRVHYTQRGVHLLFLNAPDLHCSTSKIAPGIDVKASGGYAIWWPREGYEVADRPLAEWPEWLLQEAMRKPRDYVYHSISLSSVPLSVPPNVAVAELTAALFKLDPVEWRAEGDTSRYDAWLALMMACKAAGISKEDWVAWCIGDMCYSDDADEIGRKWDGIPARNADALFKVLAQSGIQLSMQVWEWRSAGVHTIKRTQAQAKIPAKLPVNIRSRTSGLLRWLSRNAAGDGLFSVACLFAELGLTQDLTTKLVNGNLPALRKSLGEAEVSYQIARAYSHIQSKRTA
jgi:Bifunctional DNA primase/polymerase, N-terminal